MNNVDTRTSPKARLPRIQRWSAITLVAHVVLIVVALTGRAQAPEPCTEEAIAKATTSYDLGRFRETLAVLRECPPENFSAKRHRVSAHRLRALSFIASDSLAQARHAVRAILRHDSSFRSNPELDPPLFHEYVQDARPRWYSWLYSGNEWYKWTGRVLVVGGIAAVPILLTRDTSVPDLPEPPAFPGP